MSKKLLEQFVRAMLFENPEQLQLSNSLDDAIDKFFINAEKQKTVTEAEGDPEPEPDAAAGDAPEDATPDTKLDTAHFAKVVARLVTNYDNLLDIPNTIMRRAQNYVAQNYDEAAAEEVKQILEKEYELGPDVTDLDHDIQAPGADRTGPTPGGAAA